MITTYSAVEFLPLPIEDEEWDAIAPAMRSVWALSADTDGRDLAKSIWGVKFAYYFQHPIEGYADFLYMLKNSLLLDARLVLKRSRKTGVLDVVPVGIDG